MADSLDPNSTLPPKFGRYHVMAAIQGGAMGRLYLAQDPEIDRTVVVKALAPDCSQEQKTRFLREARAAGRLAHPNVVSIFDVGEQDKTPFIVMEYIEGETLSAIIKNREPILFSRRLEMIDQLCAGLAYAHDLGVVHRDIKPSNLMLDKAGKLRILDFGIARLDTGDGTQTSTGIIGTLNYMSPEQWEGGVIEGRSDLFSVGTVMYELFSFTKAFPGNTPPEVLRYMFGEGPRPLREVCPLAPPALAEVVARMMARSPDQRYANLHDVRDALAGLRAQVLEMPVEVADKTVPMGSGGPSGAWRQPPPTRGGTAVFAGSTAGSTGTATPATSATGWPMRPSSIGATATQSITPVDPNVTAVTAMQTPPDHGKSMRLIAMGAAGVIVIGAVAWFALRGNGAPTPTPPAAQTGTTAAPSGANTAETTPPPLGSPSSGDAAAPGKASPGKTGQESGRGTGRSAAPVSNTPVNLTISWSQPFEVVQSGQKLSPGPQRTQILKDVHPDRGELYADSQALRLHFRIPTDKSGSISIPGPGNLAVILSSKYIECTVVVDQVNLKKGPILPGRPSMIAEGKHIVSLNCPNGLKVEPQTAEVRSVPDPTEIHFPRDGGE